MRFDLVDLRLFLHVAEARAAGHLGKNIYGTAFESASELEDYLHRLEEAKARDHRKLGQELGLFTFSALVTHW